MKFVLVQIFLLFSFFSTTAQANNIIGESNLAKEIILFEATSYRVVTEFNVYAMQKDATSEKNLFNVLEKGDNLSRLFKEHSKGLTSSWEKYRNFAWDKHSHTVGDTYVFNDMRILHRDFLINITEVKKQLDIELLPSRDLNKANATLLIEQLASEYLELSAATFGTFGFAGSEQAIQIEVRSEAFEKTIAELGKLYSSDFEKQKAINKLSLRWRFIKSTLLAYNERSAPFAVSRTVGYIRKQLAEI